MGDASCSRVLRCRGIRAEAALSFSGLSDLLSRVTPEVSDSLLADPDEAGPDARAIGAALLDMLRRLAAFGSVLVAVDDQWLDSASAAALALALRPAR